MSAMGRPERESCPLGGSAAAIAASVGVQMSAMGRPERESCPLGGSAAAIAASVGVQ